VRDFIKDPNRTPELHDYMREAREQYGMQTFDQCLADLVRSEVVTFEVAKAAATNPSDFELQMKMFSGDSSGGSGARASRQQATEPEEEEETPPEPVEAALDGLQTGGLDFLPQ